MLSYVEGDIFDQKVEAIVNPVNLEGVMGKGLALEFRRRWPGMFAEYRDACRQEDITLDIPFVWEQVNGAPPAIICVATKREWRKRSELIFVERGLRGLERVLIRRGIRSVAMPLLGCGLGGLRWDEVEPMVVKLAANLPGLDIRVVTRL